MYTIHGTVRVNIHTYVNTTATVTTTLVQDFTHTVALGAVKVYRGVLTLGSPD